MKEMIEQSEVMKDEYLRGDVARELDFYRIRDKIAGSCVSEEGHELLLKRESSSDEIFVERQKNLGREWNIFLHSSYAASLSGWPEIKPLFRLLGVDGAQLEQDQVFALGIFCRSVSKIKSSLVSASAEMEIPILKDSAEKLPDLSSAEKQIFYLLDDSGQVRDIPSLRAYREKIQGLHREIENAIRRYTSDSTLSSALQSTVPAYRQDRELLAVRADHRSEIKGIVHEVSSSGQTIYIEPDEIVRANNDLVQAEFELNAELRRLFCELTFNLGECRESFEAAWEIMVELDMTMASAKWQETVRGIFCESCDLEKEPPVILGARHPLLGDKAIPVDIRFMDGKRVMVITGPNTGGKTVTLKTIALFALLNQAGFPIPALEGTRLPYFSSVFADIGDEQSIDDSLSTFSGHMKRMAQMLTNADEKSLVLLDELASGTDPQEGGAIAMAALDTLIEKKAFVVVTTHHGILKNYGYTNPSCVNASVEFDSETMSPTYHLVMGVPGQSHALDIASRSGLPEKVVQAARNYIAGEQADVSTLINGLNQKHIELDEIQRQERSKLRELEEKEIRIHQKEIKNKEKEIELMHREHSQSSEFLIQTRSQLENLVRELREGEINREKTLAVKSFISELEQKIEEEEKFVQQEEDALENERKALEKEKFAENGMRISKAKERGKASGKKTKKRMSNTEALEFASVQQLEVPKEKKKLELVQTALEPGLEIFAGKNRRQGTLVQKNKNGTWTVLFGSLKMDVDENLIEPVHKITVQKKPSVVVETLASGDGNDRPVFELRLLGMRQEEAVKALERQLDLCAIYNLRQFSIIHGKGQGILQQSVQDYLSHYPGVKGFEFARPEDGGTGKTYVTLF